MAPTDLGLALADRFDDAPLWVEPLAIVEVVSKELSIVGGFDKSHESKHHIMECEGVE